MSQYNKQYLTIEHITGNMPLRGGYSCNDTNSFVMVLVTEKSAIRAALKGIVFLHIFYLSFLLIEK